MTKPGDVPELFTAFLAGPFAAPLLAAPPPRAAAAFPAGATPGEAEAVRKAIGARPDVKDRLPDSEKGRVSHRA